MGMLYKFFEPKWHNDEAKAGTFRSVFKWGDPKINLRFSEGFFSILKAKLGMRNENFYPRDLGLDKIDGECPCLIDAQTISAIGAIVGQKNISVKVFDRVVASHGKSIEEAINLRRGKLCSLADIVVYPKTEEEILKIVKFCSVKKLEIFVSGGKTNTVNSFGFKVGRVALDLRKNYNKLLTFNEIDQTVTVQTGMLGWQLEAILNNAPDNFDVDKRYTCGHFPSSFEYSSVGGWVACNSSGKTNAYHGDIASIVAGQRYVTPNGIIATEARPKHSGVDVGKIFVGAEGMLGVLTTVTLKIFRFNDFERNFCYIFKNIEDAQQAVRDTMQGEGGCPSKLRILDTNATAVAFALNPAYRKIWMPFFKLRKRNYKTACLLIGSISSSRILANSTMKNIRSSARRYQGMNMFGVSAKAFDREPIDNPYLRDTLLDFGVITDQCTFAVNYSNIHHCYYILRELCDSFDSVLYSIEFGNFYTNGATMRLQFFIKDDSENTYYAFKSEVISAMQSAGAGIAVNGGLGSEYAPWSEESNGKKILELMRSVKKHLDPKQVIDGGLGMSQIEENQKIVTAKTQSNLKKGVYVVKNKGKEGVSIIDKKKNQVVDIAQLIANKQGEKSYTRAVVLQSKPERIKFPTRRELKLSQMSEEERKLLSLPKKEVKKQEEQRIERAIKKIAEQSNKKTPLPKQTEEVKNKKDLEFAQQKQKKPPVKPIS